MKKDIKRDIAAGVIVALVSIPISMGYAQVAGLPPQYGLYGSLLPILVFGLITSSPRFVFGVDAAPAALVGGMLASAGIAAESEEALRFVPVVALVTALWLFLFFLIKAGRFVKFISEPVMGGFISGIGCTIILMQLPKLFGGSCGRGELPELIWHIINEALSAFHPLSFALGLVTLMILLLFRKFAPRIPMSVIVMFAGALATRFFHLEAYGVKLLPAVAPGLPHPILPDVSLIIEQPELILIQSFVIALVIVSETLLSTNSFARRHDDKIDSRRELAAYTAANLAAAFSGCCPVNGSVSRTGIVDQFGVRSQLMSIVASISMALILLFGTGFIAYLPVPVLTAIVIAALSGILEFSLARKLYHVDRMECVIFYVVFAAVLFLGTIYGVLAGVLLSFITVIIRAAEPPRAFLGRIEGRHGFYDISRMKDAKEIPGIKIYRFTGSLFFANIDVFTEDIEAAAQSGIRAVIVDASGIGGIDVTAAERLLSLYEKLKAKNIRFYLTEHVGTVNDQLRTFGADKLINEGAVRQKISLALSLEGWEKDTSSRSWLNPDEQAAFEWAYGDEAHRKMEQLAARLADELVEHHGFDEDILKKDEQEASGGNWDERDEAELMELLEKRLEAIAARHHRDPAELAAIEAKIRARHKLLINTFRKK